MIGIENLRKEQISGWDIIKALHKDSEQLLKLITINPEFPTCILEHSYYLSNGKLYEDCDGRTYLCDTNNLSTLTKLGIKAYLKEYYAFSAEVEHRVKNYNKAGAKDKVYISFIFAETKVEVLNAFFKKDNSLSYCNGSSVKLVDKDLSNSFSQHFYGDKEGIGRYASMGGNMN